ncbi:hypothetical protein FOZ60_009398 [Perkinsus olseni]|uniref:RRM domain-containing protein n=1 Tax=Perkinsus olseni TaxID=32597 RepID=A0A7J6NJM1_PEROL|nr:hypothetical protein FOZ60_009398 [Perkinsus olseni]
MSAATTVASHTDGYTVKNTFLDFTPRYARPRSVSSPQWCSATPTTTTLVSNLTTTSSDYYKPGTASNNNKYDDDPLSPVIEASCGSTCSTNGDGEVSSVDRCDDDGLVPGTTTVTLRDLPPSFSADTLANLLTDFRGRFDFYYVPLTFRTRTSIGYAFVNFGTPEDALAFYDRFNGGRVSSDDDEDAKPMVVTTAHAQGLDAQIALLRNSPVNSGDSPAFKPRMFELGTGRPLEFPHAEFVPKKGHSHRSRHRQRRAHPSASCPLTFY